MKNWIYLRYLILEDLLTPQKLLNWVSQLCIKVKGTKELHIHLDILGPGVKVDHDHDVGAVIVGFDQNINYYKIQYAQLCINENPGCKFIATNLDAVTHLTDEQEW